MDIKTTLAADVEHWSCDWTITAPGLTTDEGLETSVIISLLTDRRARNDDELPSGDDKRGWWGDALAAEEGDEIGSRLWLLSREKQMRSVLLRAREYAEEALQWMVDDGVASSVNVAAEIVRTGVLGLSVEIVRPARPPVMFRFEKFWKGE